MTSGRDLPALQKVPVPLKQAAVAQLLATQSAVDGDFLQNVAAIIKLGDEVLTACALDVVLARVTPTFASAQVLTFLCACARTASVATVSLILRTMTTILKHLEPSALKQLPRGEPFSTLVMQAPHLARYLRPCISRLFMAVANPERSSESAAALVYHLQPFTLQCLLLSSDLCSHTLNAMMRVVPQRPEVCSWTRDTLVMYIAVLSLSCSSVPPAAVEACFSLADTQAALISDASAAAACPAGDANGARRPRGCAGGPAAAVAGFGVGPASPLQCLLKLIVTSVLDQCNPQDLVYALVAMLPAHDPSELSALATGLVHQVVRFAYHPAEQLLLQVIARLLPVLPAHLRPVADIDLMSVRLLHAAVSNTTDTVTASIAGAVPKVWEARVVVAPPPFPPHCQAAYTSHVLHKHLAAAKASSKHPGAWCPLRHFLETVFFRAHAALSPAQRVRLEAVCSAFDGPRLWPMGLAADEIVEDASTTSPSVCFVPENLVVSHLSSLLNASSGALRREVAKCLVAVAKAAPHTVVTLLPVMLSAAQRALEAWHKGRQQKQQDASESDSAVRAAESDECTDVFVTLLLLPHVSQMQCAEQLFRTMVSQFMQGNTPPRVQALGLRLMFTYWQSTGRGFEHVGSMARVLAEVPEGAKEGHLLRCAVGAVLVETSRFAPSNVQQLVDVVEVLLRGGDDQAAALAVEAIRNMCYYDVLDWYGAWRVLHTIFPELPERPLLRQQWLLMLAHAGADAREHSEQGAAVLELLYNALRHTDASVRACAAVAIAQYPVELQEELAVRQASDVCAKLVLEDSSLEVVDAAEAMCMLFIASEYSRRRRFTATPAPANRADVQLRTLRRRLTAQLPAKMAAPPRLAGLGAMATLELACVQGGGEAQTQAVNVLDLLEQSMKGCEWSVCAPLDGQASAEMSLATWHAFLTCAFSKHNVRGTEAWAALRSLLESGHTRAAANAALATAALILVDVDSPSTWRANHAELVLTLLAALEPAHTPVATVCGVVTAVGVLVGALPGPDEMLAGAAMTAFLKALTAGGSPVAEVAVAVLMGLGQLGAGYAGQHFRRHAHARRMLSHCFCILLHVLMLLEPKITDVLQELATAVPSDLDTILDGTTEPAVNAIGECVNGGSSLEALGFAAVIGMVSLLGQRSAAEVDAATNLCLELVKLEGAASGGAAHGMQIAAVTVLPAALQAQLRHRRLDTVVAVLQQEPCSEIVLQAKDGRQVAAGLVADADLLSVACRLLVMDEEGSRKAGIDSEWFRRAQGAVKERAQQARERAPRLPRGRFVGPAVLQACASILGAGLPGSIAHQCVGGVLHMPRALLPLSSTGVMRWAAQELEQGALVNDTSNTFPPWLLAQVCRVASQQGLDASPSQPASMRPLSAFPAHSTSRALASHLLKAYLGPPAAGVQGLEALHASARAKFTETHRLAACASMMSSSPWLPMEDWAVTLHRLMASADDSIVALEHMFKGPGACSDAAGGSWDTIAALAECRTCGVMQCLRLQVELLNMVFQHGEHQKNRLAGWLADMLLTDAVSRLPLPVQIHLLTHSAAAVAVLAGAAKERLLLYIQAALSRQLCPSDDALHGNSSEDAVALLQCAACVGLYGLVRAAFASGRDGNASWDSSTNSAQARILELLQTALLDGLQVPKVWAQAVGVHPNSDDVHWRLFASSVRGVLRGAAVAGSTRVSATEERAVAQLRRACTPTLGGTSVVDSVGQRVRARLLERRTTRSCKLLPPTMHYMQLLHTAWAAALRAFQAVPVSVCLDVLDPKGKEGGINASTNADPVTHSHRLRSAIMVGLLAADTNVYNQALLQAVQACLDVGMSAALRSQPAGGDGKLQLLLDAAVLACSSSLSRCTVAKLQELFTQLLLAAQEDERAGQSGPGGSVGIAIFTLIVVRLRDAAGPESTLMSSAALLPGSEGEAEGREGASQGPFRSSLKGVLPFLPSALRELLLQEQWQPHVKSVVQLLYVVWGEAAAGSAAAELLPQVLVGFYEKLGVGEQRQLLMHMTAVPNVMGPVAAVSSVQVEPSVANPVAAACGQVRPSAP